MYGENVAAVLMAALGRDFENHKQQNTWGEKMA
jgi:hypothetical protein